MARYEGDDAAGIAVLTSDAWQIELGVEQRGVNDQPVLIELLINERNIDQVAQSVDAGKLIDAIAYGGERALESGYGRRTFPRLEGGVLESSDHRVIGLPLRAPADGSFTIGNGWTLLRGPDATDEVPEFWHSLRSAIHTIDASAFGEMFDTNSTVIVRPDRIVAAVTTDLNTTTGFLSRVMVTQ